MGIKHQLRLHGGSRCAVRQRGNIVCSTPRSVVLRAVCTSRWHSEASVHNRQAFPSPASSALTQLATFAGFAAVQAALITSSLVLDFVSTPQCLAAAAPEQEAVFSESESEPSFDEIFPHLREFLAVYGKGKLTADQANEARDKMGFKRALDGRVSLKSVNDIWYSVKADLQAPGVLLLRNNESGRIFTLPADEELVQIDLSDDLFVAKLFASHAWEAVSVPVEYSTGANTTQPLVLTDDEFRNVMTLSGGAD